LILILPGFALFALGQVAAELFMLRLSMLLVFWGLVRGIWGKRSFQVMRFPLLFLAFMVPLPYILFYRIAFPLQLLSASLSAGFLDFLGMPLVRTGNIIHLSSTSIDVVTACSGLRSLLSLITFGVLAAGLFPMRSPLRVLLVLLAVPIALLANALRIIVTGILVHTSGPRFLEGTLHDSLGILAFALGVGLLFIFGGLFRWRRKFA
jgi:exosortase